jgi:hypothetical protein
VILALFSPWYYVYEKDDSRDEKHVYDMHFTFYEMKYRKAFGDNSIEDAPEKSLSYNHRFFRDCDAFINELRNTQHILYIALLTSIFFLIFIIVGLFGKISFKIISLISIIPVIFLLAAPIYIMNNLPEAIESDVNRTDEIDFDNDYIERYWYNEYQDESPQKDFFGGNKRKDYRVVWGGDLGWYFSILASIMVIISSTLCIVVYKLSSRQPKSISESHYPTPYYSYDWSTHHNDIHRKDNGNEQSNDFGKSIHYNNHKK